MKVLASPDTKRLEKQPHEGRRIERVEDGWLILNGKYYQDLMQSVNRRAYKAQKERERRERKQVGRGVPLAGETAAVKQYEQQGDGPCA